MSIPSEKAEQQSFSFTFGETPSQRSLCVGEGLQKKLSSGSASTATTDASSTCSDSSSQYDPKIKPILEKALPPWHSVAFVTTLMAFCCLQCINTVEAIDEVAILETFTHRLFPELISLTMLGWIRLLMAASIWAVMWSTVMSEGWIQTTNYRPGSKLQSGVKIAMRGTRTLFPFTSWCWILLGCSFTFHGAIALAVAHQGEDWFRQNVQANPWILRSILMVWQTTAPCAFLVSSVIRYVIWDQVKKGAGDTKHLKHTRNVFCHNLNSVYVLAEVALLGGLPVRLSEMYLGPIYGCIYIWIAWSLTDFWTDKQYGPHYIYFFLDTTLPGYQSTIALAALSATLSFFYGLLSFASVWLHQLTRDSLFVAEMPFLQLFCNLFFVASISSLVCRFND